MNLLVCITLDSKLFEMMEILCKYVKIKLEVLKMYICVSKAGLEHLCIVEPSMELFVFVVGWLVAFDFKIELQGLILLTKHRKNKRIRIYLTYNVHILHKAEI